MEQLSSRSRRHALLLGAAASCLLASPALAQDKPTAGNEPTAENSEADAAGSGVIVVTSERRATNLQDTPLSVVAFTGEMAEARNIDDLEDLLTRMDQ